jgi:hypothetical protein
MVRRENAGMVSPPRLFAVKNDLYFNELILKINEKIRMSKTGVREQLCAKRLSRSMDHLFSHNAP